MIGELPPIHQTRAGQQLLEEGIEKCIEKGIATLVRRMASKGRSPAEISEWTDLPIEKVEGLLEAEGE